MVRFKTRWLLLAIDDRPLASKSPFASTFDESASTSSSILSAASRPPNSAANSSLTPQLITRLLRASLVYNFGDVAAGAFGGVLTCKYYSPHTGTAIVRCSRDAARLVWASATLLSSPLEADVGSTSARPPTLRIRVVHCGGTIKKVQNKAIELDTKLILRLRAKQKKLAISNSDKQATMAREAKPASPKVVPVLDDDEDLGEALDPASTTTPPQATEQSTTPSDDSAAGKNALRDPETQALLARARKEISSISN